MSKSKANESKVFGRVLDTKLFNMNLHGLSDTAIKIWLYCGLKCKFKNGRMHKPIPFSEIQEFFGSCGDTLSKRRIQRALKLLREVQYLRPVGKKPKRGYIYDTVVGLTELNARFAGADDPEHAGFFYVSYTEDTIKEFHCLKAPVTVITVTLFYGLHHDQASGVIHRIPYKDIANTLNVSVRSVYDAVGWMDQNGIFVPAPKSGPEGIIPMLRDVFQFVQRRKELKQSYDDMRDRMRASGATEDEIVDRTEPGDFDAVREQAERKQRDTYQDLSDEEKEAIDELAKEEEHGTAEQTT